jgi:hypothetical protein
MVVVPQQARDTITTGDEEVGMDRSAKTWIGRVAWQAMTVGVLALVLSTLAVSPAAANQRGDAVNEANNYIFNCFRSGETPHGMGSNDKYISVHCQYGNGSIQNCEWSAANDWNVECWWSHPWGLRNPEGGGLGVDPGDTLNPGRAAAQQNGEDSTSIDEDAGKHDKKTSKDTGRKHGKAKRHGKGGRK